MSNNIGAFNRLLTRAIGVLYNRHPQPTTLSAMELWDPPLKKDDPNFEHNMQEASGTLLWLHRNNVIDGELQEMGSSKSVAISRALLTAQGYRIANAVDPNENGKTVGQIAVESLARPSLTISDLVARRFTH